MENGPKPSTVQLEIAWKTIFKVLLAALGAFVAVKLWPMFKLLIVAILLAVPLYRLVLWGSGKGLPRWAGLLLASLALVMGVVGLAALAGPVLVKQAAYFSQSLPQLQEQFLRHVPAGPLRNRLERATSLSTSDGVQDLSKQGFTAVKVTMGGLLDLVLVIALVIYLMVDGPRALQWLIAYFPRNQHARIAEGLEKIGDRMVSFIIGQSIISGLAATYVLVVMSVLGVPMALLLAIITGILDVVPILGISVSLLLGAALGLTVSPGTALLIVALYGGYHLFENYFLLPRVYGKQLRLSPLAVLVSMIAGGMVAGIFGAIAVLPLVAAYPALEVLWLSRQLEPNVVKDHQAQMRRAA